MLRAFGQQRWQKQPRRQGNNSTRRAAKPVAKTIESAAANAEENFSLSRDELVVSRIFADEGPTMKRARFGARGRYKPVLKRSSHVTVVLTER